MPCSMQRVALPPVEVFAHSRVILKIFLGHLWAIWRVLQVWKAVSTQMAVVRRGLIWIRAGIIQMKRVAIVETLTDPKQQHFYIASSQDPPATYTSQGACPATPASTGNWESLQH